MSRWLTKGQTESVRAALKKKYGREFTGAQALHDGMLSHAQATGQSSLEPDGIGNDGTIRVKDSGLKAWADIALRESLDA